MVYCSTRLAWADLEVSVPMCSIEYRKYEWNIISFSGCTVALTKKWLPYTNDVRGTHASSTCYYYHSSRILPFFLLLYIHSSPSSLFLLLVFIFLYKTSTNIARIIIHHRSLKMLALIKLLIHIKDM